MSRNYLTQAEKAEWLELFEDYDQSAAAFCREFSLPYSSFRRWMREASDSASILSDGAMANRAGRADRAPAFVELVAEDPLGECGDCPGKAAGAAQAGVGSEVLAELDLGGGHVIRVYRTGAQNRQR